MKKKLIKLIIAMLMFSSIVGVAPEVFAKEKNFENTEENYLESAEKLDINFNETVEKVSHSDNSTVYKVSAEELGINNDSFEMEVEEPSEEEMTVTTEFESGNLAFRSELYVNIDNGQFYVTEEQVSETGKVTKKTYDMYISEIEGEDFKAHLIDRNTGDLYEVNTVDAQASFINLILGPIIKNGVKWAVKKYGKKALVKAFGKESLKKAISKVADFSVKKKHLKNGGGTWAKFNSTSQSQLRTWIKEALKKNPTIKFNEDPSADKLSFTITANLGKKIGTKGETKIKVVFDYTGKIWTAYPLK